MTVRTLWVALLASMAAVGALAADAAAPVEFAWRGTLNLPAGSSLVRAEVPVEALLRMQSSTAQDLRVFNADGTVVPYALLRPADLERSAPQVQTRAYTAYPLFATAAGTKPMRGAVEVRVSTDGSAWVQWGGPNAKGSALPDDAQPLQAVLFDTRAEKHALAALDVKAELPRNALVHLTLASSDDLQDWRPVPVKGPLYRFDGVDAPASSTLELQRPLNPQGRYLRLGWEGQSGVKVTSITGRVTTQTALPPHLRVALPAGTSDGNSSLSWTLPFATPIAALHLQATQDNSLLPLRISGRADATQLWRALASTVVYRLDTVGQGSSNPPVALHGASVRGLRVEASNGRPLSAAQLQASVEFAPLQVAFLASGPGPFTLAVGRANTEPAAVDTALLGSVSPAKLAELPAVAVQQVRADAPDAPHVWAAALLPDGMALRTALLWAVLVVGVLSLAGVAYALLRQLTGSK